MSLPSVIQSLLADVVANRLRTFGIALPLADAAAHAAAAAAASIICGNAPLAAAPPPAHHMGADPASLEVIFPNTDVVMFAAAQAVMDVEEAAVATDMSEGMEEAADATRCVGETAVAADVSEGVEEAADATRGVEEAAVGTDTSGDVEETAVAADAAMDVEEAAAATDVMGNVDGAVPAAANLQGDSEEELVEAADEVCLEDLWAADLWGLFKLPENFGEADILAPLRRLRLLHHPDKNGGKCHDDYVFVCRAGADLRKG